MYRLKKRDNVYRLASVTLGDLYEPSEILSEHNKQTYIQVAEAFAENQKVALVQATGTRKTSIAIQWIVDNLKDGERAIFLAPTASIAEQHIKLFKRFGLAEKLEQIKFVLYSSVGTEIDAKIQSMQGVKYIVADEFHRLGAPVWGEGYNKLLALNSDAKVLGLSATPVRYLDGERDMAEELFDVTITGMNIVEAIENGILKEPEYVRGVISYTAELEEIAKLKGRVKGKNALTQIEQAETEIKNQIQNAQGIEDFFGGYMTIKNGKYILFCSSIEHLEEIKEKIRHGMFGRVNDEVEIYDVSYRKFAKDVKATIEAFESDDGDHLKVLLAVEMLNEGVHVGGVDGAIMMRKTISPRIFLQQLGRVLNVGQDKKPLVIDIVENYESIQAFASYFKPLYEDGGDIKDDENLLPFEIKGEAVAIDRLIRNLKKVVYLNTGNDYYIDLAKTIFKQQGNWKNLYLVDSSFPHWFLQMRKEYADNPNNPKLKEVFDSLSQIDSNWMAEISNRGNDAQAKRIARIQEYAESHGGSLAGLTAHPDKALARWFCSRKEDYRNNPEDPQWQWVFQQLSQIDPNWCVDKKREVNLRHLDEAREYFKENGSWSGLSNENRSLVQWIDQKRRIFLKNPNHSELKWVFDELSKIDPQWYKQRDERRIENKKSRIKEAETFFKGNGNSWVGITSKNRELWSWLSTQRELYRDDPNSTEYKWVFDELAKIDPNWYEDRKKGSVIQTKKIIERVKKYYQQNGWTNAKKTDFYSWLTVKRQEYKINPKDSEKQWIFEELAKIDPHWYESRNDNFAKTIEEKVARLKLYYLNNNGWANLVKFDANLNAWLTTKKEEYRSNPNDTDKKWIFELLAEIDPNWHEDRSHGNDNYQWKMLEEARSYFITQGSWKGLKKGTDLYNWLHNRKKEYKQDPQKPDRIEIFKELSKIDPNWHLDKFAGNDNYQQAMVELARTFYIGNANSWKRLAQVDSKLYKWLSARRKDYQQDANNKDKKWIFDELAKIDPMWYVDKNTPVQNGNGTESDEQGIE